MSNQFSILCSYLHSSHTYIQGATKIKSLKLYTFMYTFVILLMRHNLDIISGSDRFTIDRNTKLSSLEGLCRSKPHCRRHPSTRALHFCRISQLHRRINLKQFKMSFIHTKLTKINLIREYYRQIKATLISEHVSGNVQKNILSLREYTYMYNCIYQQLPLITRIRS